MPKKAPETAKLYYSIGEVASIFNVNTSLIRFWEKEFDVIRPKKNKKGHRLFTRRDVQNFHIIYHLVKERGYTLKGAKEKVKRNPEELQQDVEIIRTLDQMRDFLLSLKENLQKQADHGQTNNQ